MDVPKAQGFVSLRTGGKNFLVHIQTVLSLRGMHDYGHGRASGPIFMCLIIYLERVAIYARRAMNNSRVF